MGFFDAPQAQTGTNDESVWGLISLSVGESKGPFVCAMKLQWSWNDSWLFKAGSLFYRMRLMMHDTFVMWFELNIWFCDKRHMLYGLSYTWFILILYSIKGLCICMRIARGVDYVADKREVMMMYAGKGGACPSFPRHWVLLYEYCFDARCCRLMCFGTSKNTQSLEICR